MGVERIKRPLMALNGIVSEKPMQVPPGVEPTDTVQLGQLTDLISGLLGDAPAVAGLEPVEDPATATAEDCATKINEIIAALKNIAGE